MINVRMGFLRFLFGLIIELITEMLDRHNRTSNIIMFNINESKQMSRSDRNIEHINTVKDILKDTEANKEGLRVFRLGKFDPYQTRPIKVIFKSAEDARYALRNKKNIKVPIIRIYADQTKAQRRYFA